MCAASLLLAKGLGLGGRPDPARASAPLAVRPGGATRLGSRLRLRLLLAPSGSVPASSVGFALLLARSSSLPQAGSCPSVALLGLRAAAPNGVGSEPAGASGAPAKVPCAGATGAGLPPRCGCGAPACLPASLALLAVRAMGVPGGPPAAAAKALMGEAEALAAGVGAPLAPAALFLRPADARASAAVSGRRVAGGSAGWCSSGDTGIFFSRSMICVAEGRRRGFCSRQSSISLRSSSGHSSGTLRQRGRPGQGGRGGARPEPAPGRGLLHRGLLRKACSCQSALGAHARCRPSPHIPQLAPDGRLPRCNLPQHHACGRHWAGGWGWDAVARVQVEGKKGWPVTRADTYTTGQYSP